MLALTDEALCRLAVAATRVAPEARSTWLKDLAKRLEPSTGLSEQEKRRARSRRNTAAWRKREADGLTVIKFTADEAVIAVGLTQHGYLDPALADNSVALSKAAKKALLDVCERLPHGVDLDATIRGKLLSAARRQIRGQQGSPSTTSNSTRVAAPKGRRQHSE